MISELGEGAVLPTERELSERFEVSRATVRQAVGELVLEGRLSRRQGIRPGRNLISLERREAGPSLASELEIDPDDDIIHIERVLLADDERVGLESTYLTAARFPTLMDVFDPEQSQVVL